MVDHQGSPTSIACASLRCSGSRRWRRPRGWKGLWDSSASRGCDLGCDGTTSRPPASRGWEGSLAQPQSRVMSLWSPALKGRMSPQPVIPMFKGCPKQLRKCSTMEEEMVVGSVKSFQNTCWASIPHRKLCASWGVASRAGVLLDSQWTSCRWGPAVCWEPGGKGTRYLGAATSLPTQGGWCPPCQEDGPTDPHQDTL